jgi:L-ribulose-5-phosphate 3-epimerase
MMVSRRHFVLGSSAAAAVSGAEAKPRLRLGAMDGVLRQTAKPAAFEAARRLGLEGVQLTIGRPAAGSDRLPLEDEALQEALVAVSRTAKVPIDATYLDILHVNCLKDDALARQWVARGIEITRKLNAGVLMTVFFGKCAVSGPEQMRAVTAAFRELAPRAEEAGVVIGFENLLNADDNLRVFDAVRSKAFKIYYDVGNATNLIGVDAVREIRRLGRERICQFHFKDQGYLGQGKVKFPAVMEAIREIGFEGFANLETGAPSGDWEADLRRNIEFLRPLMR